jgi:hypothetical protein
MVLFFIYDEFTDNVDGDDAHAYADLVVDVPRNPHAEQSVHKASQSLPK